MENQIWFAEGPIPNIDFEVGISIDFEVGISINFVVGFSIDFEVGNE